MAPIPDPILRSRDLTDGAKVLYAQLARHEGQTGPCKVKAETLAAEIGWSKRKAERHLSELKRHKLIRRSGLKVVFLWHAMLEKPPDLAGFDEPETARFDGTKPPDLAGPSEESPEESPNTPALKAPPCLEEEERLLDSLSGNEDVSQRDAAGNDRPSSTEALRGNPNSKQASGDQNEESCAAVRAADYPMTALRSCLAEHFGEDPSEQTVRMVLEAAGGNETEAVLLLTAKKHRGFARGEPKGPNSWAWFVVTVRNHFSRGEQWPSEPSEKAENGFTFDGGQDLSPLRTCLREYLGENPTDRTLANVLAAAGTGTSQADIVALLERKRAEFPKGHAKRPHTWAWFISTVRNHFDSARQANQQPLWRMPPDRVLELAACDDADSAKTSATR